LQTKGRIERLWDTFQDRLKSEPSIAGANTAKSKTHCTYEPASDHPQWRPFKMYFDKGDKIIEQLK
jgi:hypothetical protein